MEKRFHELLREHVDTFVHRTYQLTKSFPREEMYTAASQLRRAALSVALNYIEGFARKRRLVKINFFEISFGSLQESKYLLEFACKESWIQSHDYNQMTHLAEKLAPCYGKP